LEPYQFLENVISNLIHAVLVDNQQLCGTAICDDATTPRLSREHPEAVQGLWRFRAQFRNARIVEQNPHFLMRRNALAGSSAAPATPEPNSQLSKRFTSELLGRRPAVLAGTKPRCSELLFW
jgi:hypothetical protein